MSEISLGSEIAGLRIEEVAGRGGSSVVYRATDLRSGRTRAAKVLHTADPASRRRLQDEAALLSRIDHPAIVPFRRLHQSEERAILITDWVDGQSLLERLRLAGPITPEEALGVLCALAGPLDHLHAQGVVHRDISPANVIVKPDGTLMVIDLGIGFDVRASTPSDDDVVAGTPNYLAPEVLRGEPACGASDQYSVAVMLHELISGRSPFPPSREVNTALHHQLGSAPAALHEIDPTIPAHLSEAVLRALAKDPEERFDSMIDFAMAADPAVTDADHRYDTRGLVLLAAVALAIGAALIGLVYWFAIDDRSGGDADAEPSNAVVTNGHTDPVPTL